ncbi:MAG: hypothetical protein K0R57_143 [Paenibacillaceae bacterium]|jgi:two-component system sensor histidine kinase YesM|nr:hypothetical protein [Paenibacillaceae bacterium]
MFIGKIWPHKLKYRLFASVLFFILIPFSLLQMMAYRQIEDSMELEFKEKAGKQLTVMKSQMTKVLDSMFRYYLFLEHDPDTRRMLLDSSPRTPVERQELFGRTADRASSIRFPSQVTVTMADRTGQFYQPDGSMGSQEAYRQFVEDPRFAGVTGDQGYTWMAGDSLQFYGLLQDGERQITGYVRMDFDYKSWLDEASRDLLLQQSYQIVDESGTTIGLSDIRYAIDSGLVREIISGIGSDDLHQIMDRRGTAIVSGTYSNDFNWYILSYLPMNNYLGNLNAIRAQYLVTFVVLCLSFILISFLIAAAISRPLQMLRRKMALSVESELRIQVHEDAFTGEMKELAVTFNTMMEDIRLLLTRLKQEERLKEALHYRMLAAHMNPHFLMNTLNTIKWNALDKNDTDTADICIALGKLLETTLNSEVELIHLKQELELMHAYMYIQNYRYEGLVAVDYEVDPRLEYALVPKLSLQPLMENALKHGFAHMPEDARVTVRVYTQGQQLIMEMEDNGSGLGGAGGAVRTVGQDGESLGEDASLPGRAAAGEDYGAPGKRKGIGLANIEERLRLLFRAEGSLTLEALNRGVLARITLPLLISNPYAEGGEGDVEGTAGGG